MLDGLRVIDLSADVGGAFAARLLAVYGADVVLVEPPEGHAIRHLAPHLSGAEDDADASILAAAYHAGKRSLTLDLGATEDRAVLEQLIAGADAVIESHAPGALAAKGVNLEALREQHPALVVTQVTPYGQTGPRAGWRATALTAAAGGGEMALCGEPDQEPLKTAGHQAHLQGGLHAFSATATALYAAAHTGIGDRIDLSLQELQNATLEGAGPAALTRGSDATRGGNTILATFGIHPCADGYIGLAGLPRQSHSIYHCIEHPELKDDPLFNSGWSPEANGVLQVLVPEWTMRHTASEIFQLAVRYRTPFSMIPTPRELLEWPGLVATGFWHAVEHPLLGSHPLPAGPIVFDGDRGTQRRAPLVGEHSAAIRAELEAASTPTVTPPPAVDASAVEAPLAGVRVIDVTQVWAGPFGCRFLADMGADTIKIEGPTFPDSVRGLGASADPDAINRSAYFNEYNRNKRGLAINLQQPAGAEAVKRLIAGADVFVENWSSGVADRLGLGYEALRAINPRLIYVSMPGFGHDGPDANRVGYGPTIEQMGGLVALQGYAGGPPHKSGISYGDPVSGTTAAGAVGVALHRREHSDQGCYIVVPQRDGIVGLIGEYLIAEGIGEPIHTRIGNRDLQFPSHNVYRTRDTEPRPRLGLDEQLVGAEVDTWLAVAVDADEAWLGLRSVVADPRLDDASYDRVEGRRAAQDAIDAVLGEWARKRDPEQAAAALQAAGVAASPVHTALGLANDAHLDARGAFTTYDHAVTGVQRTTLPAWRFARRPVTHVGPAPAFGQHNVEVLTELAGYSEAEVEAMGTSGLIATAPVGV